jgi:hypothetical protein
MADRAYRLEGLNFGCLLEVVQAILHVVDSHAAIDAIKTTVGYLRHALISAVSRFKVPSNVSHLDEENTVPSQTHSTAVQ